MHRISVSDLKTHLSRELRRVREGASVVVTDRGIPVAMVIPVMGGEDGEGVEDLVDAGVLLPPRAEMSSGILARVRPPDSGGSVLQALLQEREEGP